MAASYSDLSISEFGFGYCTAIKREHDEITRAAMLDHLTALFKDATTAPWSAVKDCNAAILHEMEAGQLTWTDTDQIRAIRLESLSRPAIANHKQTTCQYCFKTTGRRFNHAEEHCIRKQRATQAPKNEH